MKLDREVNDYLTGTKFSSGLLINIAKKEKNTIRRLEYLKELVLGKKVIHLGFTDHTPLIKDKIKQNIWLHKILVDASEKCVGVDVNCEAVEYVRSEIGINDVYCHDITSDVLLEPLCAEKWDYLILGELLEHINNPVSFLSDINDKYGNYFKEIVITVPNAFDLINIRQIFKRKEFINTDHRFWFTPYTLSKVVSEAGFEIIKFHFCQSYLPKSYFSRLLINIYPNLREGLILHAKSTRSVK
ncbi:methyltransferase domain-containing protein [Niastella populi]|uniref:Methyltransferase domain-containing protein n=1 Tax=Niastella populi TaxID=550983 RepID=A0A1V9GAY2_9BACT|nr:methyltransferase domain-containing protein [Niastella populi]OQP67831.1 hypothetical protein A4R26_32610 [Niastella populi]